MNPRKLRTKDYLLHMLDSIERIQSYTSGVTQDVFVAELMMQDAVVRNVEIIGEAAKNLLEVSPDFAASHPEIPFAQIYGMRNRVAHGYFAVSASMIWDTVQFDIPELRDQISKVLEGLENQ